MLIYEKLKDIINKIIDKDIDLSKVQVMAPMYKGEVGIDRLNSLLQNLINPSSNEKIEYQKGDLLYREGDKILQTYNNEAYNWSR